MGICFLIKVIAINHAEDKSRNNIKRRTIMQNYKITIAYDGRKYKGFGKSKGHADKTIQGKLEAILTKLYKEEIEVIGAVNTSAGVHAKEQIVNFIAPNDKLSNNEIFTYLEKYLTDDIITLSLEKAGDRFHSRYLAKSVTYEYRLWKNNAMKRPLFERQYVNVLSLNTDVDKMKRAAKDLVGSHDFLAFSANRKVKKSIKEMYSIDIEETKNEIRITMKADGFLLNMERFIVGSLVQIGMGQLPIEAIGKAFEYKASEYVGYKASADALCLVKVEY